MKTFGLNPGMETIGFLLFAFATGLLVGVLILYWLLRKYGDE